MSWHFCGVILVQARHWPQPSTSSIQTVWWLCISTTKCKLRCLHRGIFDQLNYSGSKWRLIWGITYKRNIYLVGCRMSWLQLWYRADIKVRGRTALTHDKRHLLVGNLSRGRCELYETSHLNRVREWTQPCKVNVPRQVDFINGTKMMVSGSDDGQILIWDWEGVMVQALAHCPGKKPP